MHLNHWNKIHICGVLAARFGLRRYLEITTTETGARFREARELGFDRCDRLVYRNAGFTLTDGLPVTYAEPTEDISASIAAIRQLPWRYDIILVDAHHTYDCAWRDLSSAFELLAPGGVIVVHDCFPQDPALATPHFQRGDWCGVSYKAYVDFIIGNPRINYATIDTDYGCGIIMSPRSPLRMAKNAARAFRQRHLKAEWAACGEDYDRSYALLHAKPGELLRLGDFAALRDLLRR